MKTYLLDTIDRFKRFSQSLDVKTILCSKAWYVLNEDGDTENLIFQEDGIILVSVNGSTKKYTWKFIPQNQSLNIMHSETEGTMLKPAFLDNKVLAFQKIGTKECMFLIDDAIDEQEKLLTIDSVKNYLIGCEQKAIEEELKIIEVERKKKLQEELEREEEIKKLKEKIKNNKKYLSKSQKELENGISTDIDKVAHILRNIQEAKNDEFASKTAKVIAWGWFIIYSISVVLSFVFNKEENLFLVIYSVGFPIIGTLEWVVLSRILKVFDYYWSCYEFLRLRYRYSYDKLKQFTYRFFKCQVQPKIASLKYQEAHINELQSRLCMLKNDLKKLEENN